MKEREKGVIGNQTFVDMRRQSVPFMKKKKRNPLFHFFYLTITITTNTFLTINTDRMTKIQNGKASKMREKWQHHYRWTISHTHSNASLFVNNQAVLSGKKSEGERILFVCKHWKVNTHINTYKHQEKLRDIWSLESQTKYNKNTFQTFQKSGFSTSL